MIVYLDTSTLLRVLLRQGKVLAIHLASALQLRERGTRPVVFATHDARQVLAARALGFACTGV